MDFSLAPLLAVWEVTQACDLACLQCRGTARPERDPGELTTAEGFRLLDELKEFGNPLVILTGGDPLARPDLQGLAEYSLSLGLRTNITPSATPRLTQRAVDSFKTWGISRMAIAIDGPDAATHDGFRGLPGTYGRGIAALRHARGIGLDTQIQTTVHRGNFDKLAQMAEQVADLRARLWSLFFLVDTNPGMEEDLTGEEYERVFAFLYEISRLAPYDVKTTEAIHYRRYFAQRLQRERQHPEAASRVAFRMAGVSDGRGFVFISHRGEIFPSGFLPIGAGNVRTDSIVDVYRSSTLFRTLRDPEARNGKCCYCDYHRICGGSRARAYALTGDYLAADPRCCYQPATSTCCASA